MKFITELSSENIKPRLTPHHKKTERALLSVFMRLLELIPHIRGDMFSEFGFRSGKTSSYQSFMEVSYPSGKYPDGRPDGLVHCKRGTTEWSAFIEAKSGASLIRPDQIQAYAELGAALGVDALISISNEFAREPSELPYHVATNRRRKRDIFHLSWSDIQNRLELYHHDANLSDLEKAVLADCLNYFEDGNSGVLSYDTMPKEWPDFVQSSGVGVGFNSKTSGITEIVHGWHQERRDIRSKLMKLTKGSVQLKHQLGPKALADDILNDDRKRLAECYELSAMYSLKGSRAGISVLCELQDRKITASIDIYPPSGKAARASVSWLSKQLAELTTTKTSILVDWKGKGNQRGMSLEDFLNDPEAVLTDSKDAPKKFVIIRQVHDVRRFKSRKFFISDVEAATTSLVTELDEMGLL